MLEFKEIRAKDNHIIKLATALVKSAKARKENGLFLLEGLRICKDAVSNGVAFDTLIVSKTAYQKLITEIRNIEFAANSGVLISDDLFKKISDTTSPQGIIALAKIPLMNEEINPNGRYIALEHIADPANIGAIARTAEALGVSGIIVSGDSCDVYSPKALRASMGTLLRVPIYFCDEIITFLRDHSLRGFACIPDNDADIKIDGFVFSDGDAVIIGNEANGLTEYTKGNAYSTVNIPMRGKTESLNAASAAAIAMWELIK